MTKVLLLPSWHRYKRNPSAGIFILNQAKALARTGKADVTLLNWGQNEFQLRIRDPLHSLGALKGRVFSKHDTRILEAGLTELSIPHLTWTSRFLKGNIDSLANKVTLDATPDIIHAHVAFPAGYLAMLLSQKLGVPYIITEHSGPFPFGVCQLPGHLPLDPRAAARGGPNSFSEQFSPAGDQKQNRSGFPCHPQFS